MKSLMQYGLMAAALAVVVFVVLVPVASALSQEFATLANAFPQTFAQRSH